MFMALRLADQGIYIFAYFVNTTQLIRSIVLIIVIENDTMNTD